MTQMNNEMSEPVSNDTDSESDTDRELACCYLQNVFDRWC